MSSLRHLESAILGNSTSRPGTNTKAPLYPAECCVTDILIKTKTLLNHENRIKLWKLFPEALNGEGTSKERAYKNRMWSKQCLEICYSWLPGMSLTSANLPLALYNILGRRCPKSGTG